MTTPLRGTESILYQPKRLKTHLVNTIKSIKRRVYLASRQFENNVKQKRSNRKSTYCMIYSDKQKEQWYMTEVSYVECL